MNDIVKIVCVHDYFIREQAKLNKSMLSGIRNMGLMFVLTGFLFISQSSQISKLQKRVKELEDQRR